jgi:hypothetical protein
VAGDLGRVVVGDRANLPLDAAGGHASEGVVADRGLHSPTQETSANGASCGLQAARQPKAAQHTAADSSSTTDRSAQHSAHSAAMQPEKFRELQAQQSRTHHAAGDGGLRSGGEVPRRLQRRLSHAGYQPSQTQHGNARFSTRTREPPRGTNEAEPAIKEENGENASTHAHAGSASNRVRRNSSRLRRHPICSQDRSQRERQIRNAPALRREKMSANSWRRSSTSGS